MTTSVTVKGTGFEYPVWIGSDLVNRIGELIHGVSPNRRAALLVDTAVHGLHGVRVVNALRQAGWEPVIYEIPSGESSKALEEVGPILSWMAQQRFERRSPVIALGGGVVGDLAGFVAAIYLRGVPFVQIPTTLLSMVDSSVGGKTGVNLPEGKNLVGAFYQPSVVLADVGFLETLPARELAAGMAEVIKYGIIADASLFAQVESGIPRDRATMIKRCVEIKAEIVGQDEKEITGVRALLNFGHTLGHAIENAAGYGVLLHGEAISVGMRAAAFLSQELSEMTSFEVKRIESALVANHLPLQAPELNRSKVRHAMGTDKKVQAGKNRWVLSTGIGHAHLVDDVPMERVERVIERVC